MFHTDLPFENEILLDLKVKIHQKTAIQLNSSSTRTVSIPVLLLLPPNNIYFRGVTGSMMETVQFDFLTGLVETATGWFGLVIIFVYSFLIAFVLPTPSEVVLAAPLDLGLGSGPEIGLIVLTSGLGKAVGSIFAFHIGQKTKDSGFVFKLFNKIGWDLETWSEKQSLRIARKYGYAGLAMALSVPFFPDTASIYAFSILERDYLKFAAATFVGSVGRLVVTLVIIGGIIFI